MHGWDEAMTRAREFKRIGVDAVFVEALPDRDSMTKCVQELDMPVFANSEYYTMASKTCLLTKVQSSKEA